MVKAKKPLSKIKSGSFSRGFALARVTMNAGAKAASHAVGNVFGSSEGKADRLKELVRSQIEVLASELGQLKGSVMKVGQMLSMYGEHLLPPEANALLKTLQSQSPPLDFKAVQPVLKRQLGEDKLALLEIDPTPIASASLGQVHRAVRKSDGKVLALKVQYPGVDQAIESDIKTLRSLLSMSKLIPRGPRYDELFTEVRHMLRREVDYKRELTTTEEFRARIGSDKRYIIPETFPEFSTGRVLATSFEEGVAVDSPEVLALSQERRNALGEAFLDLYFRELYEWGEMQTDPHFGNYRIRLANERVPGSRDQLILFDFGAVRKFDRKFLDPYFTMVRGAFYKDQKLIEEGATGLGFFRPDDSAEVRKAFAELCFLITEPFYDENGDYEWGNNDLPKRAMKAGSELAFAFKLRPPPREIVFLDRKMGGVFVFLSVLKVHINARKLVLPYLEKSGVAGP